MAELDVRGLSKSFAGQPVLQDVTLAVPAGRLVAILGPSGSGKTTLLRLICGFERADSGSVTIGGRQVCGPGRHVPPERRHIGYVAQEGALFPHLSVAENITFGLPRRERRQGHRVAELLDLVGLPPAYASRSPETLSGGEQQRVAVARALAPEPSLVLLDEPFSALDAALRVDTRHAVAAAFAATGATALLVTHDQMEALSMGHEVAVLRQGALVQVATPDRLYRYPMDAELAQFVGEAGTVARNGERRRSALRSRPATSRSAACRRTGPGHAPAGTNQALGCRYEIRAKGPGLRSRFFRPRGKRSAGPVRRPWTGCPVSTRPGAYKSPKRRDPWHYHRGPGDGLCRCGNAHLLGDTWARCAESGECHGGWISFIGNDLIGT